MAPLRLTAESPREAGVSQFRLETVSAAMLRRATPLFSMVQAAWYSKAKNRDTKAMTGVCL